MLAPSIARDYTYLYQPILLGIISVVIFERLEVAVNDRRDDVFLKCSTRTA